MTSTPHEPEQDDDMNGAGAEIGIIEDDGSTFELEEDPEGHDGA